MTIEQAIAAQKSGTAVKTAEGQRAYLILVGVNHHKFGNVGRVSYYKNELASLYIGHGRLRPQDLVPLDTLTIA